MQRIVSCKCPHCHVAFSAQQDTIDLDKDAEAHWVVSRVQCPTCNRFVLQLRAGKAGYYPNSSTMASFATSLSKLIRPEVELPHSIPQGTPKHIAQDYIEATIVRNYSPNASAALSRRCLQSILRDVASKQISDFKPGNLADEIERVINSNTLPPYLSLEIDAVRNIGNFAAHPEKSATTGLIIDVEPDESEWNLGIVDRLLQFYFVESAESAKRRAALNEKLQGAGKRPMK